MRNSWQQAKHAKLYFDEACKAIFWPTLGSKETTFNSFVLSELKHTSFYSEGDNQIHRLCQVPQAAEFLNRLSEGGWLKPDKQKTKNTNIKQERLIIGHKRLQETHVSSR